MSEVGGRIAVERFLIVGARVGGVAAALGVAAEPIEGVHRAARGGIFAQEIRHFLAGVGLALNERDSGDSPFGVVYVSAGGEIIEDTLVIAGSFSAIEFHPVVVAGGHEGFFGPVAL